MDSHGLSLDLHAVRDILLRVGKNPDSGQSILLDTNGGIVLALGKDEQGRSITGQLDGAIEITIRPNAQQKAIRLSILGDIDISHKGHLQYECSGDWVTTCNSHRHVTKTDDIKTTLNTYNVALSTITERDHRHPQQPRRAAAERGEHEPITWQT